MTTLYDGDAVHTLDADDAIDTLAELGERISAPPGDRDPLLWAAHESVQAARLLLEARAAQPHEERSRLVEAAAQSRSAAASLHYAMRERS